MSKINKIIYDVVIVGGGAAAYGALLSIKDLNKNCLVINNYNDVSNKKNIFKKRISIFKENKFLPNYFKFYKDKLIRFNKKKKFLKVKHLEV